jgi:hypothetical protein
MIGALLLALATGGGHVPAPVQLRDDATWTIATTHRHAVEGAAKSQSWAVSTRKQVVWKKARFTAPEHMVVSLVSAEALEGAPPAALLAQAAPVDVDVDQQLRPGVYADQTRAKANRAELDTMVADLAIAARAQGMSLIPGQAVTSRPAVSSPLPGVGARADETWTLVSVDSAAKRAVVRWSRTVDPESFKASLADLLKFAAKVKDPKMQQAGPDLAAAAFAQQEVCRYEIDLPTGLAAKAECTRESSLVLKGGATKTSDSWTLTQSLPEAR